MKKEVLYVAYTIRSVEKKSIQKKKRLSEEKPPAHLEHVSEHRCEENEIRDREFNRDLDVHLPDRKSNSDIHFCLHGPSYTVRFFNQKHTKTNDDPLQ